MVGLRPPFAHFVTSRYSRTVSGRPFDRAPPWRWGSPPPQGSSLGSELCCLGPSSLNRPHPPHPRAHRDFTAWRLIRDAFAVRERRGDPRVVPGFRCPFLPDMPSSLTPGSSIIVWSRTSMSTWPSPRSEQLGTPNPPAIRFTRGTSFGASWFAHLLRPVRLLALLYGSDRYARPPRAFTSRLPTDRSPSPLLDMTTTATGLLVWGFFCQGVSASTAHLSSFVSCVLCSTRKPVSSSRPATAHVARRSCQGWSPLRRPPAALGLDSSEHGGTIECSRAESAR